MNAYADHWHDLLQVLGALRTTWRRGFARPHAVTPSLPFRGRPVLVYTDSGDTSCVACERCADACPTQCLSIVSADRRIALELDWRRCIYCGICARVCPVEAIALEPNGVIEVEDRRP